VRKRQLFLTVALAAAPTLSAQVTISPRTASPADLVRFAVQVANPLDAAVVAVHVEIPEALAILGVDGPPGWAPKVLAATDSTPQAIDWTGGRLTRGDFREFAFFARLAATARRTTLVFPVRLRRDDGTVRDWRRGGEGQAPTVEVRGSVGLSTGGAFTLAAAALGLAALATALALRRPR
jgi:uncharacterized protein YcnI